MKFQEVVKNAIENLEKGYYLFMVIEPSYLILLENPIEDLEITVNGFFITVRIPSTDFKVHSQIRNITVLEIGKLQYLEAQSGYLLKNNPNKMIIMSKGIRDKEVNLNRF